MSHRPPTPPPRTLLDTGERERIVDEAVAGSVEKVREEFVTDAECRINSMEAIKEFHATACPARGLASELSDVKKDVAGINLAVTTINVRMDTAIKLLRTMAAAAFALALALGGAAWTLWTTAKSATAAPVPAHVELSLDASPPALASFEPVAPDAAAIVIAPPKRWEPTRPAPSASARLSAHVVNGLAKQ